MRSFLLLSFVLVFALFTSRVAGLGQSLADCQSIASQFRSTCTVAGVPESSIANNAGTTVTCNTADVFSCPGTTSGTTCTFKSKLCVTCSNSTGTTRIRVQSNDLPPYCFRSPVASTSLNIDFEVNFNPAVSINSPRISVSTQAQINAAVCVQSSTSLIPSTSNYQDRGQVANAAIGMGINGVLMYNPQDAVSHDPYNPPVGYTAERTDSCIGHPDGGNFYHYHLTSPCLGNSSKSATDATASPLNVTQQALNGFSTSKFQKVVGIAKDGHVINGYYYSSGVQVTTGFDICNGVFLSDGSYQYFSTTTFPYFFGCYGPSNYPTVFPGANCTSNPPKSYAPLASTSPSASLSGLAASPSNSGSASVLAASPSNSGSASVLAASQSNSGSVSAAVTRSGSASLSIFSLFSASRSPAAGASSTRSPQATPSPGAVSVCVPCFNCVQRHKVKVACRALSGTPAFTSTSLCCNNLNPSVRLGPLSVRVNAVDSCINTPRRQVPFRNFCAALGGTVSCFLNNFGEYYWYCTRR